MNFDQAAMEKILASAKDNKFSELELRIGSYVNNKFIAGVKADIFNNISMAHKKFVSITEDSVDNIYTINNESWRVTESKKSSFYIQKRKLKNVEISEYNCRLSHSSESIIINKENNPDQYKFLVSNSNASQYSRYKTRTKYNLSDHLVLDMTIVKLTPDSSPIYEVELEFIKLQELDYKMLTGYIQQFLTTIQDTFYILSNSDNFFIRNAYLQLAKDNNMRVSDKLLGPQAVTLKINNLVDISTKYAVTDKADGERMNMYFYKNGIYLINSHLHVKMIGILKTSTYHNSVIDGEYVNKKFFAFDMLYLQGHSFHNNVNALLFNRLAWIQEVQKYVESELKGKSEPYFHIKKFYSGDNIYKLSKYILDKPMPYKLDGLIYTPIESPLPKNKTWTKLYKWKFSELNSIDLKIEKIENNTLQLYVFDGQNYVIFNPNSTKKTDYSVIVSEKEYKMYSNGDIVEFVYDYNNKKLFPLRSRPDKVNSNYIDIAFDIFENILNPITTEHLTLLASSSESDLLPNINNIVSSTSIISTIPDLFVNMRTFHNKIKREQIKSVTNLHSIKTLLSLCCGKGGDIHKWNSAGIKKVIGFDLNPNFIDEAIKRYKESTYKTNMSFNVCDLSTNNITSSETVPTDIKLYLQNNKIDAVEAQFSIHYFLRDKKTFHNFMLNVVSCLKVGGIFYGTLLRDNEILNLISKNDMENFNIRHTSKYDKDSLYGNAIEVSLKASTIDISQEYLVNFKLMTKILKESYNLELIKSEDFSNIDGYKSLENYEKSYSKCSSTFVYKYIGSSTQIIDITQALDLVNINKSPVLPLWKYWKWKNSQKFSGYYFSTDYKTIDSVVSAGNLHNISYILVDESGHVLSSSFSTDLLEIKSFISCGTTPFIAFVKIKTYDILLAYEEQGTNCKQVLFNKEIFTKGIYKE